jgi:adenine-specific DNA-methyltransferase
LEGFLRRELEFYLKDQVLHLGDLEGDLEAKRRTLRVIRQLAEELITFLAQIENVQRRLFEKRKFVLRTDYLVPIKDVPEKFWKEVLANKAQIQAWKELFAIEPRKVNEQFLKDHPTLVVSTAHFGHRFKDQLLASFEDLDEATDGLLLHAENYQALRLLERKYPGKIKCIYIDPPYNTGSDEFIYKDRYRHSSWLAMMEERLVAGRMLMREDGLLLISIDDREVSRLRLVLDGVFGQRNLLAELVWEKTRKNDAKLFSVGHEYMLAISRSFETLDRLGVIWREPKPGAKEIMEEYQTLRKLYQDDDSAVENGLHLFYQSLPEGHPSKKLSRYRHVDKFGPWRDRDISWPGGGGPRYDVIHPATKKPCRVPERGWGFATPEAMEEQIREGLVVFRGDHTEPPIRKAHLMPLPDELDQGSWEENNDEAGMQVMPSVIYKQAQVAVKYLRNLFGRKVFDNPKDHEVIARLIAYCTREDREALVVDYFAGSGTTADATIDINRSDGGRRKFMLVEMADYFNTVLLPRIQKVMYTPEWKDGKPKRLPTKEEVERTPRLVKVLRLEGYEDALHNLTTEETLKREELRANAYRDRLGGDTYRLQYLARLPLETSASMLNLAALEHPFRYTLDVLTEDGPRVETVDLVETFNFLYGLHVERLEAWVNENEKRTYRAVKGRNRDGRRTLVLWRDVENLDPAEERRFLEARLKGEGPFDEVFINCDTATPGVRSLDGLFKRLLEEEER